MSPEAVTQAINMVSSQAVGLKRESPTPAIRM
jgi:hypothetical protein